MKEVLEYQVDEVAAALRMPPRTIERYVSKVLNFREVKANTIGRQINNVSMHPHVEFLITEAVLLKAATYLAILYADRGDRRKSPGVSGAFKIADIWHVRYRRLNSFPRFSTFIAANRQ